MKIKKKKIWFSKNFQVSTQLFVVENVHIIFIIQQNALYYTIFYFL